MSKFNWKGAGKIDGSFELRSRNVKRTLIKDADLICLVCGHKPKRGEECYYPGATVASHNKILGHVACVDRVCSEHTARSANDAAVARLEAMRLIPLAAAKRGRPKGAVAKPKVAPTGNVAQRIDEELIRAQCMVEALAKVKSILEMGT